MAAGEVHGAKFVAATRQSYDEPPPTATDKTATVCLSNLLKRSRRAWRCMTVLSGRGFRFGSFADMPP